MRLARLVPLAISLLAAAAGAGCGSKCPPEEPCVATDAGLQKAKCVATKTCGTTGVTDEGELVFDCGSGLCRGAQLCVAPSSCQSGHDFSSYEARCEDKPAACDDVQTQCDCTTGPDAGTVCCHFAGWQPYSFNVCNFACQ